METDDNPEFWVERYGDALFSYALVRVNDHSTAEDLVQETLLSAVKKQSSFDGRSSRLTWLIAILKRKVIDHYRRTNTLRGGKNQVSLDELPDEFGVAFNERGEFKRRLGKWPADPAKALQKQEFWEVFHACRQTLPPNLLTAFNMRELDQFDTDKICTELGITASNLAVRTYRARLLLRQCIERKWFRDQT